MHAESILAVYFNYDISILSSTILVRVWYNQHRQKERRQKEKELQKKRKMKKKKEKQQK